jgi:hypothetical protein
MIATAVWKGKKPGKNNQITEKEKKEEACGGNEDPWVVT